MHRKLPEAGEEEEERGGRATHPSVICQSALLSLLGTSSNDDTASTVYTYIDAISDGKEPLCSYYLPFPRLVIRLFTVTCLPYHVEEMDRFDSKSWSSSATSSVHNYLGTWVLFDKYSST